MLSVKQFEIERVDRRAQYWILGAEHLGPLRPQLIITESLRRLTL